MHAPDWRRRGGSGRGVQRSCDRTGLLSPAVVRHPLLPCLRFAPPCQITSIGTRHGSTTQAARQADRYTDMGERERGLHLNLLAGGSGTRSGTGGREGGTVESVTQSEKATKEHCMYNCCTLLCAGGMDGEGGAIYMDGSEQRPRASERGQSGSESISTRNACSR